MRTKFHKGNLNVGGGTSDRTLLVLHDQPPGSKHVVDEAKEHHNVKYVYVRHVLAAYWVGVNPTVSVALKTLVVIHRTLREGDPTFREELQNFQQRGCVLQLANFKDDSSPIAWDCSTWVRTYGLFLEERLECFRILKYDIEAERIPRLAQGQDKWPWKLF